MSRAWTEDDAALAQHRQMLRAFERNGGTFNCDEVGFLLEGKIEQPVSNLARWIVSRAVVSFTWRSQTFLPMFQFDLVTMTPRAGALQVIRELADVFDDWELAHWYSQPHSSLDGAVPVDVMEFDQPAVLKVARADRFIVRG